MKKIIILGLFLLSLGFSPLLVKADVIMPNTHPVQGCAKIVNLDKFTDIVLIGYITGPMINKYDPYQIKNNECLTLGYKFNSLGVYWTTKEKFKNIDLKNLKLKTEKVKSDSGVDSKGNPFYYDKLTPLDFYLLISKIDFPASQVEDKNPLIKETIDYNIIKTNDGNYVLYKSKSTSEYNNGAPSKTETFPLTFQDKIEDEPILIESIKLNPNGIRKTSSISDIKNLQIFLNSIQSNNLLYLKVDGKYGPKTTLAIKNFQTLNKLKSDGIFGKLSVAKAITILK